MRGKHNPLREQFDLLSDDSMLAPPSTGSWDYDDTYEKLGDRSIETKGPTSAEKVLCKYSSPSLSSSVRKLVDRQSLRRSAYRQKSSSTTGPILSSFDEEDVDSNDKSFERCDGMSVSEIVPFITTVDNNYCPAYSRGKASEAISSLFGNHSDSQTKDAIKDQLLHSQWSSYSTILSRSKLHTPSSSKRHIFPDPGKAISNLFGIKLRHSTTPNLLDKIDLQLNVDTRDVGVEMQLTDVISSRSNHSQISKEYLRDCDFDVLSYDYLSRMASKKSEETEETMCNLPSNTARSSIPAHSTGQSLYSTSTPKSCNHSQSLRSIGSECHNISQTSDASNSNLWNSLNALLFVSYALTSAASTAPISLMPSIASDLFSNRVSGEDNVEEPLLSSEVLASHFVSTAASYSVFTSSLGKFINGPIGDIFGARRISCLYSALLSLSLLGLSFSSSERSVIIFSSAVEFFQGVQWPCLAIILASHYGDKVSCTERDPSSESRHGTQFQTFDQNQSTGYYERGVYAVSLGARIGQLTASFATTVLLRYEKWSWRSVCRLAAQSSLLSSVLCFCFIKDSPTKLHDPQNPVREANIGLPGSFFFNTPSCSRSIEWLVRMMFIVFMRNVLPSLRSVLSSITFWVVALAHSGGSVILTSSRILGTYFKDTSYGTVTSDQAGELTAFLSIGILVGLALGGNVFASLSNDSRARKSFIQRLYMLSVGMCYILSILAVPVIRSKLQSPSIVTFLQMISSFFMGAGVAVQLYCIPAIVGATFGANKGLYFSYTDGVAYFIGSLIWGLVSSAVSEGNPQGSGWAYGWAAVALLVILSGWLMVEFVGYYFSRGGWIARLHTSPSNSLKDIDSSFPVNTRQGLGSLKHDGDSCHTNSRKKINEDIITL